MKNWDSFALPLFVLLVSSLALGFGLLCIVAPRRAILMSSRYSMQVTAESALSTAARWKFRIIGVFLVLGALFFIALTLGNLLK
jgi:hypothetical protein